jgi:hypothetical protein
MNRRRQPQPLRARLVWPAWLKALPERLRALGRLRLRRGNRRTWRLEPSSEASPVGHESDSHTAAVTHRTRPPGAPPSWREVGLAAAWLIPVGLAVLAFATPVLGLQAVDGVRESRHFHVREVVVAGHRRLSETEVLGLAGITPGMSVLEADLEVLAAPLRAHPWVRWAKVERELPSTLRVTMIEREACAYLATGDLWLVDETGEVFAPADPVESLDIPVISGVERAALGEAVADPVKRMQLQVRLQGALNLARTWRIHGLSRRYPLSEVRLDPVAGHVLVIGARGTVAPIEVVLGEGPLRVKLQRLEFTLEALRAEGRQAEYVLLDLGDEPLALLQGPAGPGTSGPAGPGGTRSAGARVIVRASDPAEDPSGGGGPHGSPPGDASPGPAAPAPELTGPPASGSTTLDTPASTPAEATHSDREPPPRRQERRARRPRSEAGAPQTSPQAWRNEHGKDIGNRGGPRPRVEQDRLRHR